MDVPLSYALIHLPDLSFFSFLFTRSLLVLLYNTLFWELMSSISCIADTLPVHLTLLFR
jgi:hypothetical protein